MLILLLNLLFQTAVSLASSPELQLVGNSDADGIFSVRLGKGVWPCKVDFVSAQGKRLVCGEYPYPVEFVYTPGENDGAAVYYTRVEVDLKKHYFACSITEKNQILDTATCQEKPQGETGEESKLLSPIKSTLTEVNLLNAHLVHNGSTRVVRGMAPKSEAQYRSLLEYGIDEVIIFKNPIRGDVAQEIEDWKAFSPQDHGPRVYDIEFKWKDHDDYNEDKFRIPCRQTIQALRIMKRAEAEGSDVFFHCTVGEDRTGMLAGVYRLLREAEANHRDIFENEMCDRGYERGNAFKPYKDVDVKIRASLTKLYLKFAYLIQSKQLNWRFLNYEVCERDPEDQPGFSNDVNFKSQRFRCDVSTRFRP